MARWLPSLIVAIGLLSVPAAAEDTPSDGWGDLSQALDDLAAVADRLQQWVDDLPRYGIPRITEDGDILVPRREPPLEPPVRPLSPDDVIEI
ncbi:hypothetical protein [Inquilinus sp. CAU 1745]|uniref:hypothetical protein n=1 Tax=Inquilinus sp. CAU 1745 TaxID=3140369 RepID=UPI00325AF784